jgi:hypothetical protein
MRPLLAIAVAATVATAVAAPAPAPTLAAPAPQRPAADPQFADRDAGPDRLDVSGYPPEQQARYPLFVSKCSKCHTLARPINTRFEPARWKRYARKMIRKPNSGINEEHARELFEFLKYYAVRTADR